MALTVEQLEMLGQPLNINSIKHRPGGGGRQLKYIKGDSAIDTANRIFGFGQWGYKIVSRSHQVIEDEKKGRIEFYTADIELSVLGAAFPISGDGVGIVNAPFTVEMHEKAYKEASTDALKRALRHYGDQFGLSLYDEDDYVETSDGTLVQVKEVKPNLQRQQPKRIIEASVPVKQIAPVAATQPEPPQLIDLHQRCEALYPGKWNDVQQRLFGSVVADEEMTTADRWKMHQKLSEVEQKRKQAS